MNAQQVHEFIATRENNDYLGILEKVDLNQKPPIILPHMNRKKMSRLFRKLGYRTGVEIGVYKGIYTMCLRKCIPGAKIYCIDPYEAYEGYQEGYTQEQMDALYEDARTVLDPWPNLILKRMTSMDAVKWFNDNSIDFVHIDGNHAFEYVTNDIAEWSKKVRPGGAISGHDYVRYKRNPVCHVKDVVNSWTYSHGIKPWFVLRGDKRSSWFWIKR